jgi:hypothetical protein
MTEEAVKGASRPAEIPGIPSLRALHIDTQDDMYDSPGELEGNGLLPQMLRYLQMEVCEPYWPSNEDAIRFQAKHQWITTWALWTGTAAVTAAIAQLIAFKTTQHETLKMVLAGLEFLAAFGAGIFVVRGVKQAIQKKWLLERHKAERLRFLKYRSLLEAVTNANLGDDLRNWKLGVRREADTIRWLDEDEMIRWLKENRRVKKDDESMTPAVGNEDLNDIMEYYKRKRLEEQIKYLFRKSQRTSASDSLTKFVPPVFFVLSIACAVSHMVVDVVFGRIWPQTAPPGDMIWSDKLGLGLIIAAAVLPVWGAAVRTHRSANEFSRNTVRFKAVYHELCEFAGHLVPGAEATAKLRWLWRSEEELENEHREWLRLMDEAEWYG